MQDFHWVTSNRQLQELCLLWQAEPFIVLDTEFVRVDTYYPRTGLIQLAVATGNYLLDPLQISQWDDFARLLENPDVVKVVHACGEDLEVFQRLSGALPQPLYDTQLAAAYAGLGFSWGYARLVEHFLQIELPKGATRSDWLQRPLSSEQELYAVQDVSYLARIYPQLDALLTQEKRSWLLEDGAALVAAQQPLDLQQLWQGVKQAWTLNARQAAALQLLCVWREEQARQRDIPRNWVLKEAVLLELAHRQPDSMTALERIDGISPGQLRHNGKQLLAILDQARELPDAGLPEALPEPLPLQAGKALKRLRKVGERFAAEQRMAPELTLKKKILTEALATGWPGGPFHLPDSLHGWRLEQLGPALQQALDEEVT
ncbi:MAG: ribonuclease D [Thiopseudomonas sp.]